MVYPRQHKQRQSTVEYPSKHQTPSLVTMQEADYQHKYLCEFTTPLTGYKEIKRGYVFQSSERMTNAPHSELTQ